MSSLCRLSRGMSILGSGLVVGLTVSGCFLEGAVKVREQDGRPDGHMTDGGGPPSQARSAVPRGSSTPHTSPSPVTPPGKTPDASTPPTTPTPNSGKPTKPEPKPVTSPSNTGAGSQATVNPPPKPVVPEPGAQNSGTADSPANPNEGTSTPTAGPCSLGDLGRFSSEAEAHRFALQLGRTAAQVAWRAIQEDCHDPDAFFDRLLVELDKVKEQARLDPEVTCLFRLAIEGMNEEIAAIGATCNERCFGRGDGQGRVAAHLYCQVMATSGGEADVASWIRGALTFCGVAYELGCDAAFQRETYAVCDTYADGDYFNSWESSRLYSCDYNHDRTLSQP